jgi:hypothetical protein
MKCAASLGPGCDLAELHDWQLNQGPADLWIWPASFYGSGEHDDVSSGEGFLVISQMSACLGLKQTNRDRSVCTHPEPWHTLFMRVGGRYHLSTRYKSSHNGRIGSAGPWLDVRHHRRGTLSIFKLLACLATSLLQHKCARKRLSLRC